MHGVEHHHTSEFRGDTELVMDKLAYCSKLMCDHLFIKVLYLVALSMALVALQLAGPSVNLPNVPGLDSMHRTRVQN